MLEKLNPAFRILTQTPAATAEEVQELESYFGHVPPDYRALVADAAELEFEHESGQYFRIWEPAGCVEMYEAYLMNEYIEGAYPIGDDGGGLCIIYYNGKRGPGLYHVGFGDLDGDDANWIATSLSSLLIDGVGAEKLGKYEPSDD